LNYYRLKQFDFDGDISASNVVVIESKKVGVKLYPNPSKVGKEIIVSSELRISSIAIIKLDGTTILTRTGIGQKTMVLDAMYDPGAYVVVISTNEGGRETLKLIIQ